MLKTYRAFTVKYISATNTKPSRVSVLDNRFQTRKIISYNHEYNNIYQIAQAYLESKHIDICGVSELGQGNYILFTDNFNIDL